jgi:argininosuccinate lyase
MAEDLMIWSTKEFGFIELDDKYCSVSSVMPQKRNPDTLEITRGKISKIISNQFTALMITKAIPSGYFRDFQELKMLLKNSFELLISIISIFTGLFSSIKINEEKMVEAVNESNVLALDLAEFLVCEHDVPFRQSHEIVATLIRNSENIITSMDKDNIEKETLRVVGKKISLSEESLNSLKDLKQCLDKRVSQGSPSKHEVEKSINLLEGVKQKLHESFLNRVEKVKKSNAQLMNLIKKLTS